MDDGLRLRGIVGTRVGIVNGTSVPQNSKFVLRISELEAPETLQAFVLLPYSYRSARTGSSREARRAGRTLARTAISIAPVATHSTVPVFTAVGISWK